MATEITIPDFDFSGFYYAEILEALIQYKRQNVPELTDESEFEPFIQLLRATALVGHLNNVLLDLVANESTLPTAKLVETVRNMLRLIDYELSPATPAQVDLVYELAKVFLTSTEVIPERAQAATKKVGDDPVTYFEALEALTVERTDQFSYVYGVEDGSYTDHTTEANSATTPGDDWTPWATPAVGDSIYLGHKQAMWDEISVGALTALASGITGVWEFYDGEWAKSAPSSVVLDGSNLVIDLTAYLGSQNRQGTMIRVSLNETGAYEDVASTWTGTANIATVGLLGQSSPSTEATDYTVGSDWSELPDLDDATADFSVTDEVIEFSLPQDLEHNWIVGEVNGSSAYWLRYRIVEVSVATGPTLQRVRLDTGKQYIYRQGTQGRTVVDSPLGSSTGLANQEFELTRDYFINGSESVYVDNELWTRVENFLSSTPTEKHYTIELGDNDRPTVKFGDGTTGKIPPLGVGNIKVDPYRYNAETDGNVGANTVVVDKTGLSFVNKVWNPRGATGWTEAEGASEASLEQAKIAGPASLRTREVAVGAADVEALTVAFEDSDGANPYSRALIIEEAYGPKTLEVVVVTSGGGQASAAQLEALETYFNGDQYAYPPIEKHLVANQEVTCVNHTPKTIDIVATVYGDVTAEEVTNALAAVLHAEALKDDGVSYEWEWGEDVPRNRLIHEIFDTDESITNVTLTTPAADVPLTAKQLPVLGTVTLTIVEP
jgi:predicted phage baseplate assembly protein